MARAVSGAALCRVQHGWAVGGHGGLWGVGVSACQGWAAHPWSVPGNPPAQSTPDGTKLRCRAARGTELLPGGVMSLGRAVVMLSGQQLQKVPEVSKHGCEMGVLHTWGWMDSLRAGTITAS